ncbi:MAG: CocE/NonD family hydrolase [Deltaproteobacteria bacterium]|nr:MAG: CocE/NonD family hydrolase [Deltaproteobacteria bacterium]
MRHARHAPLRHILIAAALTLTVCRPTDGTTEGDAIEDAAEDAAGDTRTSADTVNVEAPCGTARVREDLAIPTLDDQRLHGWLYRPAAPDCPLPTILIQTPYSADAAYATFVEEGEGRPLTSTPFYNVVAVDWRGRFGSAGLPEANDPARRLQDSWDVVEWIAAQPWSDGQVGTWGVSALCGVQYRTATGPKPTAAHPDFADGPPPHLRAMVPIMCAARTEFDHIYVGGVARLEGTLALDVLGFGVGAIYLGNPRHNLAWTLAESGVDLSRVKVPALVVSGFWDLRPDTTRAAFHELLAESDPSVRDAHRLLIGPWIHFATGGAVQAGAGRPLVAAEQVFIDGDRVIDADSIAFFDRHLRGVPSAADAWDVVRYHQENEGWHGADTWPPAEAETRTFYLTDALALDATPPSAGTVELPYDPEDPSPTLGGGTLSPYNCVLSDTPTICAFTADPGNVLLHGALPQDALRDRADQRTFATAPLDAPLRLLGEARLVIDVATTGEDADVAVRVLDLDAAGSARLIGDGVARVSARNGNDRYDFVPPGTRATVTVSVLNDFAYTLPAGHRLGVMVSGSNWPLYARNPGDGAVYVSDDLPDGVADTFTFGVPSTTVSLRGTPRAVTHTLFLDGASRLEIGVAP